MPKEPRKLHTEGQICQHKSREGLEEVWDKTAALWKPHFGIPGSAIDVYGSHTNRCSAS